MSFNTTWMEKVESRSAHLGLADPTADLVYIGVNTVSPDDDTDANQSLIGILPLVFPGALYAALTFESYEIKPLGGGNWEATAHYRRLDSLYTFDIGGGTQTITQSLATVGMYGPAGTTAPDYKGAIGVDNDKIKGVDIHVPSFDWEETYHFNPSLVPVGYPAILAGIVWHMNQDTFRGFQSGEVLFVGARGSQKGFEDVELTYKFSRQAERNNFMVGDITVTQKVGWDYLWIRYADQVDTPSKTLVKVPSAVYVERVYDFADFTALLIGS